MRLNTDLVRLLVSVPIILSHFLSFYLVLTSNNIATPQERLEISLVIGPIFAVYVAAIVRKISSLMAEEWDTAPTHPLFSSLAIFVSLAFSFSIPLILYRFINAEIATVKDLKTTLGIIETALGLYTGAIIDRLFGSAKENKKVRSDV